MAILQPHFDGENRLMVGAFAGLFRIGRGWHSAGLSPFLQRCFGIARVLFNGVDARAPQAQDKSFGSFKTRILVNRGDQCLKRIAQQRLFAPPA